jgi:hypothetical protein
MFHRYIMALLAERNPFSFLGYKHVAAPEQEHVFLRSNDLLVAQRYERIDFRSSTRGKIAGEQRYDR